MSKTSKFWIAVLVVGLVALIGFATYSPAPAPSSEGESVGSGGNVTQNQDQYSTGLTIGNNTLLLVQGTIGPGQNQGRWRNTTGRTMLVDRANLGYTSGTASSSYYFYVSTSTASSVTDYARPTGTYLPIDAAIVATSSGPTMITSTSTSAGQGTIMVPNGAYVIFDVQERYACKVVGVCETATSTNRGITNFSWSLQARYANQ